MATEPVLSLAPAHRTGSCPSGDVTLHYRALGKAGKAPILINHGLSYFSYDWLGIAADLAADREVIAFDMRGFGDSTESGERKYGIRDFAQDIVHLMDHLEYGSAVLLGHSMGGRNVMFCAAENPARVAAVIGVDSAPQNAPAGSDRIAKSVAGVPMSFPSVDAAVAHFGRDAKDPAVRARFEAYLKPVPGGFAIKRDTIFRERMKKTVETGERPKPDADLWQVLAGISCPILVVRGAQSDMFAPEMKGRITAANARATVVEVAGGHNVGGDNPKGLVAAVRQFLDQKGL